MGLKFLTLIDYFILVQIVASILIYQFTEFNYKNILVLFSCIIFFCYWVIRIIFNPKMEKIISGG